MAVGKITLKACVGQELPVGQGPRTGRALQTAGGPGPATSAVRSTFPASSATLTNGDARGALFSNFIHF